MNIGKPNKNNSFFLLFSYCGTWFDSNFTPFIPPTLNFLLFSNETCQEMQFISITYVVMLLCCSSENKNPKIFKNDLLWLYLGKNRTHEGRAKNRVRIFFVEITKRVKQLLKPSISSKYHTFWRSYEWFSTLSDVLLSKWAISSRHSCGKF